MQKINVSEFKAICLRLLEQIRQTGQPIEILKNGEPLAIVYPPNNKKRTGTFGVLKSSVNGKVGDLTDPLDDVAWDALTK
jgi:antitoxin (DNA-binding transcriptional repressor) of toxin-antitoxin stability system